MFFLVLVMFYIKIHDASDYGMITTKIGLQPDSVGVNDEIQNLKYIGNGQLV